MNNEEIYNAWTDKKRWLEIRQDFSETLMNRLRQHEKRKRKPLVELYRIVEFVSAHSLARTGLILAGATAGLVRFIFTIKMALEF